MNEQEYDETQRPVQENITWRGATNKQMTRRQHSGWYYVLSDLQLKVCILPIVIIRGG